MARIRDEKGIKHMNAIADRMRLERLSRGYTQEEFAEILGVSSRQYGRYENKKSDLSCKVVFALKDLGVEISYLLDGITFRDKVFHHCLQTMPEDELYPKLSSLKSAWLDYDNATDDEKTSLSQKAIDIVNDLLKYGKEHYYDKKLREAPEVRYDTLCYEEYRDELIKKNSTRHKPQIK